MKPIACRTVWKTNDFVVLCMILQQIIVLPHYAGVNTAQIDRSVLSAKCHRPGACWSLISLCKLIATVIF